MSHQQLPRDVSASAKQQASGRQGRGARLRHIIATAIERRSFLRRMGKGRPVDAAAEQALGRLQLWLQRNPYPSEATVSAFPLEADVLLTMPSTAEGRNYLNELRTLLCTPYQPTEPMTMLKSPEELALVREKHEYLRELQKAADVSPLDWREENGYLVHRVGKLTLKIAHNTRSDSYEWTLLHERSGRLTSGSSEHQTIAQQEAVAYAKNYVNTAMVGVMA